jgi:hypothetical protein
MQLFLSEVVKSLFQKPEESNIIMNRANNKDLRDRTHHINSFYSNLYKLKFPHFESVLPVTIKLQGTKYVFSKTIESATEIDTYINEIQQFWPTIKIHKSLHNDQLVSLKITINNFKCIIQLKPSSNSGLQIEQLSIFGVEEKTESAFAISEHAVFQKMTETTRLVLQYLMKGYSEATIRRFLTYLTHFEKSPLFTSECKACGKMLHYENERIGYVPPTFRHLERGTAIHPHCANFFQLISRPY